MKLIAQILALYLPAASQLQVMASIAILFIFLKTWIDQLPGKMRWAARRTNRKIESDMWAIE